METSTSLGSEAAAPATVRPRSRVVIVGAGFGGLTLARSLRRAPVDIVLIDRNNYHTFQPLLYQVATAGLEPEEIAHSVRGVFHRQSNVKFVLGEVGTVDWSAGAVVLADGARIDFDQLVLAAGATTSYFGVAGAAEHGFPLKSLEDALTLRSHIIRQFEDADRDPRRVEDGNLNFVIVGGGPTGVEIAGALHELFRVVFRKDYPALAVDRAKIILLEATSDILGTFHPRLRQAALKALRARGIEVVLGEAVVKVDADSVSLRSGTRIPTRTLIWAAGVRAAPLADALGLEQSRGGRIRVEPNLSLPGKPHCFVIGDMAAGEDAERRPLPQVAPVALQGARHVAAEILARIDGRPARAFRYRDPGSMATIGRNCAIAHIGKLKATGFFAWMLWLGLHLVQLVGFRNRLNVLVNWFWNYVTFDRSARLLLDRAFARDETSRAR